MSKSADEEVAGAIIAAHTDVIYDVHELGSDLPVQEIRVCLICQTPVPCDAVRAARMLQNIAAKAQEISADFWLPAWVEDGLTGTTFGQPHESAPWPAA